MCDVAMRDSLASQQARRPRAGSHKTYSSLLSGIRSIGVPGAASAARATKAEDLSGKPGGRGRVQQEEGSP